MEQFNTEVMQDAAHRQGSDAQALDKFSRLLATDHWLKSFMTDLLAAHEIGHGLDFQTTDLLLKQEKESFEADLLVAQRMHRMYPHLFHQESDTTRHT